MGEQLPNYEIEMQETFKRLQALSVKIAESEPKLNLAEQDFENEFVDFGTLGLKGTMEQYNEAVQKLTQCRIAVDECRQQMQPLYDETEKLLNELETRLTDSAPSDFPDETIKTIMSHLIKIFDKLGYKDENMQGSIISFVPEDLVSPGEEASPANIATMVKKLQEAWRGVLKVEPVIEAGWKTDLRVSFDFKGRVGK